MQPLRQVFLSGRAIPFLVLLVGDLSIDEQLRELAPLRLALEWHGLITCIHRAGDAYRRSEARCRSASAAASTTRVGPSMATPALCMTRPVAAGSAAPPSMPAALMYPIACGAVS